MAQGIKFLDPEIILYKDLTQKFFDDFGNNKILHRKKGVRKQNQKYEYANVISSFDIETTRLHDIKKVAKITHKKDGTILTKWEYPKNVKDFTVMYTWQWCFTWNTPNGYTLITIIGRKWSEFTEMLKKLSDEMGDNVRLVVFDHNLAYEFQFLRGVIPFDVDNVFNIKTRQPIKAVSGKFEFRCTLKQSNMSLRKFAESMQTQHQKTTLNYNKKRYWYTPLDSKEMEYICNDVICLNECMLKRMQSENDDLYTIPLTSTGYVRREVKKAVKKYPQITRQIKDMCPDFETYMELKEAFRGGNTHANRYYSNSLLESKNVGYIHSADRSSSYPAVICNAVYPMSKFEEIKNATIETVLNYITIQKRAVLMRVSLSRLKLHDISWGCPYLSYSKCRNIENCELDNGRILSADYLETTITDIDLQIIISEYDCNIDIIDAKWAKYGTLPRPIIDEVIKYYKNKTNLKGVKGQEYFYTKNKNLLNSIYGMMVQDLVKVLVLYYDGDKPGVVGEFMNDPTGSPVEILKKANKKAFLNYAWGVWVTAWARYELEQGIRLAGDGFLYCDTDSVKYIGNVDWSRYNNSKKLESKKSGSHATDPAGVEHYMGVFEPEHDMEAFKTMGAKKYAYIESGELHITIAGVGKKSGVEELEKSAIKDGCRGIDEFKEGYTFAGDAGGLEAVYNDMALGDKIIALNEDGRPVEIVSNVTLRPSMYTIGLTADYSRLLAGIELTEGDDIL